MYAEKVVHDFGRAEGVGKHGRFMPCNAYTKTVTAVFCIIPNLE